MKIMIKIIIFLISVPIFAQIFYRVQILEDDKLVRQETLTEDKAVQCGLDIAVEDRNKPKEEKRMTPDEAYLHWRNVLRKNGIDPNEADEEVRKSLKE